MHGPVCGLNYLSTYMKRGPYSHVNNNSILPTYIDITDIAHSLKCCLPVDKRPTCTERVEFLHADKALVRSRSWVAFSKTPAKHCSSINTHRRNINYYRIEFDYISFELLAIQLNWKAEIASFAYLHHANQH